jgi:hypothetical protein
MISVLFSILPPVFKPTNRNHTIPNFAQSRIPIIGINHCESNATIVNSFFDLKGKLGIP